MLTDYALRITHYALNLIYSNNYLISLGPLLAIACLLYLRFRDKICNYVEDSALHTNMKAFIDIKFTYNRSQYDIGDMKWMNWR
ncbi:MAG: hypothetical protein GQ523_07500 [Methanophagales archaeon]|nr:hypothetical protein [Methanophagales archaeon]